MPGGSPGSPGPGVTHARGYCPSCYREVAGGVDHDTGRVVLRYHKRRPGGEWCSGRQRMLALTEMQIAIRYAWDYRTDGLPEPTPALLEYARKTYGPEPTPADPDPTGCPACGSDDYDTELGDDSQPDYESGLKKCLECGEEWV